MNRTEDNYFTKFDSKGAERQVLINSRVPNDERSLQQKNLRRRRALLKPTAARAKARAEELAERAQKRTVVKQASIDSMDSNESVPFGSPVQARSISTSFKTEGRPAKLRTGQGGMQKAASSLALVKHRNEIGLNK